MSDVPFPIARVLRRAKNAKADRTRHDLALDALELSVRLAVIANLAIKPAQARQRFPALKKGSLGVWATAWAQLVDHPQPADAQPVIEAFHVMELSGGKRKRRVSLKELANEFPHYRNRWVHSAVQDEEHYGGTTRHILEAIAVLWDRGFFLHPAMHLAFVGEVAPDGAGGVQGRVMPFSGESPSFDGSVATLPAGTASNQIYVVRDDRYFSLSPWLLYAPQGEVGERVWNLDSYERTPVYSDHAIGSGLPVERLKSDYPWAAGQLDNLSGTRMADAEPSRPRSEGIAHYDIVASLGAGGMGEVFLTKNTRLNNREVALKTISEEFQDSSEALSRFRREVSALARCDHPNVVKVLDAELAEEVPYYTMEFVEGADLGELSAAITATSTFREAVDLATSRVRTRVREGIDTADRPSLHSVPTKDQVEGLALLLRGAAEGLAHLHEHGVIHRDIKPANLMVTRSGDRLIVMDLGIAAVNDATRTLTHTASQLLGTLRYMAPEQFTVDWANSDQRVDVYGLGATFYELLAGRAPYAGESPSALIASIMKGEAPPLHKLNPHVSRDLSAIIQTAISRDRAARYSSAQALADDLDAYLGGRHADFARHATSPFRRAVIGIVKQHPVGMGLSALALVACVIGAGIAIAKLNSAKRKLDSANAKLESANMLLSSANQLYSAQLKAAKVANADAKKQAKRAEDATRNAQLEHEGFVKKLQETKACSREVARFQREEKKQEKQAAFDKMKQNAAGPKDCPPGSDDPMCGNL